MQKIVSNRQIEPKYTKINKKIDKNIQMKIFESSKNRIRVLSKYVNTTQNYVLNINEKSPYVVVFFINTSSQFCCSLKKTLRKILGKKSFSIQIHSKLISIFKPRKQFFCYLISINL